jgi:hypothetical protein
MRSLILGLLLAFGLLSPAAAQGTWGDVPCADSYLEFANLKTCRQHSASRTNAGDAGATSARYGVNGWVGGIYVNFVLTWPYGNTYMRTYTNESAMKSLKVYNTDVRDKAVNWGELRNIGGDISYASFKLGTNECVGIDQAGPPRLSGYAWHLFGYACSKSTGRADEFTKAILANLRIGRN